MEKELHITEREYELIEGYLEGSLSEEMELEFGKKSSQDPDWSKKTEEVKVILVGLERLLLAEEIEKIHQEKFSATSNFGKIKTYWFWVAAASIVFFLLVGVSFFGLFENQDEKLFQTFYETDPGLITAMSGSDNYEFDRGMVDFKSDKFSEAIQFWEPLLEANPEKDTLIYFVAMAKIEEQNYRESEVLLIDLISNEESEFIQDGKWYLALLYIKKGEIELAKNLLKEVQKPDAKTLLEKLK